MSKSKLLSKNRKLVKVLEIEVDGGKRQLQLRRPTFGDRARVIDKAKAAGEIKDKDDTSLLAGAKVLARAAAVTLYDPETGRPEFNDDDLDDLVDAPWLEDVQDDVMAVFNPKAETVRGN